MQFLIIAAVLVGLVAATDMDMMTKKKAMAMKILTMDAKDMHKCMMDSDCTQYADTPMCCEMMKVCKPADMPSPMMMEGECTGNDHSMCKPMRRCMNGKCHFSGPKACTMASDCLQGVQGMMFDCMELPKTAPGMRCYMKCTEDSMCHDRMPEEYKTKIGCCGGFCQKKSAC